MHHAVLDDKVESGDSGLADDDNFKTSLFPQTQSNGWSDYAQTVFRIAINKHRACLFISVYFWLCVHWMHMAMKHNRTDTLSLWNTLCIVYLLYLYECYRIDRTHKYIDHGVMDVVAFSSYMENIMQSCAVLKFHGRHSYGSSSVDRADDKTEYTYKVQNFTDKSKRAIITAHLTKVRCNKEWSVWSDADGVFQTQREEFIAAHESAYGAYRNTYTDDVELKKVPFSDCVMVYSSTEHLPLLLRYDSVRCGVFYLMLFGECCGCIGCGSTLS